MATYRDVITDVKQHHSRSVKTCWVAHVKEQNGLRPRLAANRTIPGHRRNPCPDWARHIIEESMRRLGML